MGDMMELETLDRQECLRLLAGRAAGRVSAESGSPTAVPVNYIVDGQEVVFRLRRGSAVAAAARNAIVAFEVDDVDSRTHTGWSVLGIGESYEVDDQARLAALARRMPDSWAPRRTAYTIAIPLTVLRGRRLSLADWVSDRLCTQPDLSASP
ncbi:MAG: pyridoxamine 5'-phosphate oxidase family protein [Pseudonocardia sp.]|nr:pyridoxamine 5'-phosphate oxidase family protein [Pseudonocardia sp.]